MTTWAQVVSLVALVLAVAALVVSRPAWSAYTDSAAGPGSSFGAASYYSCRGAITACSR